MRYLMMILALAGALAAQEGREDAREYARMTVIGEEGEIGNLPLEHTSVAIEVSGNLQRATVRQVYGNPHDEPIEAVYVFPLPQDGAVDRMDMWIGDRLIHGEIHERDLARRIYEDALESGQTASLLEQERPNIFTQSVGNILPGDSITVEISYVAPVDYDDGYCSLVFPMVVGPRFIPGEATGSGSRGWADPTDQVPDADRITPPVVPEGTRAGYDIDLAVLLRPGVPVGDVESVNHEVSESRHTDRVVGVKLADRREIPNRDFVLRWRTAGDSIETGVLAHNGRLGGHFMMILQPDLDVDVSEITPKEMFFVVDCSGSMSGQPMEVAKETVRQFVSGMNPDDSFQIIRFSESASGMAPRPLENTSSNVSRGISYINSLRGGGGTMMIEGIRASVGYPEDEERMRYVIFLTDGYIGNEAQILGELQTTLGERTRLFSIGVGSSPNRYLIEGLAEEGRGHAYYVALSEDPSDAVGAIYEKINDPYLVGIDIDWNGLDVEDVYPQRIPDLYAGAPLVVTGRYGDAGSGEVTVSGTIAGRPWSQTVEVDLPAGEDDHDVIQTLWARKRIHELNRMMYNASGEQTESLVERITDTALDYQIMSRYTSFVAVSEEVRVDGEGRPTTVEVPVNMPQGVSYEGVFGGSAATGVVRTRTAAPAAAYGGGGTGLANQSIALEECAEPEDGAYYSHDRDEAPEPTGLSLSLGWANPTLGILPSSLREALREALEDAETDMSDAAAELAGDLPGSVVLSLSVSASGSVTGVSVDEGLDSEALEAGLVSALEGLQLSAPPEGAGTVRIRVDVSAVY
jgi:Ca-activated chloride channel family protein